LPVCQSSLSLAVLFSAWEWGYAEVGCVSCPFLSLLNPPGYVPSSRQEEEMRDGKKEAFRQEAQGLEEV